MTRRSQEALEHLSHVSAEAFTGHRIVKAFGAEARETTKFHAASQHLYRTSMKVTGVLSVMPPLMEFIDTLPFEATGRMLIMYDPTGGAVSAHRDHDSPELCHEFIWFRTNLDKPFFMLDHRSGEKLYVTSHSAWFDTVNQFHGADATGDLSISIRVDGIFRDDFRRQIPYPQVNRAAAPALLAAVR